MAGLIPIVFIFGIIVLVGFASAAQVRRGRALDRLLTTGMQGCGVVLDVSSWGTRTIMGARRFEQRFITLDIEVPGQAPYMVRGQQLIPTALLRRVLPGATLQVRVDPGNPSNIALPTPGQIFAPGYAGMPGPMLPAMAQAAFGQTAGGWGVPTRAGAGPVALAQFGPAAAGAARPFAPQRRSAAGRLVLGGIIAAVAAGVAMFIASTADDAAHSGAHSPKAPRPTATPAAPAPTAPAPAATTTTTANAQAVCAAAAECCRLVTPGNNACALYEKGNMSADACRTAYETRKRQAAARGKKCR